MRIVSVCRGYPTHRPGGMLFVCQDRARQLAKEGHEVHVLTTGTKDGELEAEDEGVNLHHLPCEPLKYTAQFANACKAEVDRLQPDIVHLDSFDRNAPWFIGIKQRVAITMHGFGWGSVLTNWNLGRNTPVDFEALRLEQRCLSKANVVIGVSAHEEWLLRDTYQLPQARLVYNPIPEYFFENTSEAPEDGYFLCASVSGGDVRGHHTVCEAGKQLGVEVKVCTNIAREWMPKYYDGCKAFVLPTRYAQGADLSVFESIARCRPVILSPTGSYLIEHRHRHGLRGGTVLLRDFSVEAVKEAMQETMPIVERGSANCCYPENHAVNWLNAVLGDTMPKP